LEKPQKIVESYLIDDNYLFVYLQSKEIYAFHLQSYKSILTKSLNSRLKGLLPALSVTTEVVAPKLVSLKACSSEQYPKAISFLLVIHGSVVLCSTKNINSGDNWMIRGLSPSSAIASTAFSSSCFTYCASINMVATTSDSYLQLFNWNSESETFSSVSSGIMKGIALHDHLIDDLLSSSSDKPIQPLTTEKMLMALLIPQDLFVCEFNNKVLINVISASSPKHHSPHNLHEISAQCLYLYQKEISKANLQNTQDFLFSSSLQLGYDIRLIKFVTSFAVVVDKNGQIWLLNLTTCFSGNENDKSLENTATVIGNVESILTVSSSSIDVRLMEINEKSWLCIYISCVSSRDVFCFKHLID
jgi:hypothetical protein